MMGVATGANMTYWIARGSFYQFLEEVPIGWSSSISSFLLLSLLLLLLLLLSLLSCC